MESTKFVPFVVKARRPYNYNTGQLEGGRRQRGEARHTDKRGNTTKRAKRGERQSKLVDRDEHKCHRSTDARALRWCVICLLFVVCSRVSVACVIYVLMLDLFIFSLKDSSVLADLPVSSCVLTKFTGEDGKDVMRPYTPVRGTKKNREGEGDKQKQTHRHRHSHRGGSFTPARFLHRVP